MKINLQAFEPLHRPLGNIAEIGAVTTKARKSRLRLTPVVADTRLFHAWHA